MLKKIRDFLAGGLKAIIGLGEIKQGNNIVTAIKDFLTQGVDIITGVDRLTSAVKDGSLSEADKLRIASKEVANLLLRHPALTDHKIQDGVLFEKACDELAQGFFDLRKSLSGDNVQAISKEA